MKVLVTGAGGQLGKDTAAFLRKAGHDVQGCGRADLDITNQEQCMQVVMAFRPDAVIHCAAYTAVDQAEADPDEAYRVNADGTRNMAMAAEKAGAKLVYISTDYVFNGRSAIPYREYDSTDPQGVYGKSKRAGELLAQTLSTRYFIVRTSWVYGQHGHNFVKTMLRLGAEKPLVQVVHDQKGSPTYTVDLAGFLSDLIQTEKYGIYHASNSGDCTWFEFTQAIFEEAREAGFAITARLEPCTTAQFPRPAPRPANSVMDHGSIRTNGFSELRHWREGLREFIHNLN